MGELIGPPVEGVRIPAVNRKPKTLSVLAQWFGLLWNPADDTTYRIELAEMPFIQSREVSQTQFLNDYNNSALRLGRITRITNRTGNRPASDVVVIELGGQKVGWAVEVTPDATDSSGAPVLGAVALCTYEPPTDRITPIAAGPGAAVAAPFAVYGCNLQTGLLSVFAPSGQLQILSVPIGQTGAAPLPPGSGAKNSYANNYANNYTKNAN